MNKNLTTLSYLHRSGMTAEYVQTQSSCMEKLQRCVMKRDSVGQIISILQSCTDAQSRVYPDGLSSLQTAIILSSKWYTRKTAKKFCIGI